VDDIASARTLLGSLSAVSPSQEFEIRDRLLRAVREALEESHACTEILAPSQPSVEDLFRELRFNRSAASDANVGDEPVDLVIRLTAVPPLVGGPLPDWRTDASSVVGSVFLWVYGILPSWLVADRQYEPILFAELVTERTERSIGPQRALRLDPGPASLRFYERSSLSVRLLSIVVPAVFIFSDPAKAREALLARNIDRLAFEVASHVKTDITLDAVAAREPLLVAPREVCAPDRDLVLAIAGEVTTLLVDGAPPTYAADPESLAAYLGRREQKGASRVRSLQRVEDHLLELALSRPVPSLSDLGSMYPQLYQLAEPRPGPKSTRVEVVYRRLESGETASASWTLPGCPPVAASAGAAALVSPAAGDWRLAAGAGDQNAVAAAPP
jgi:hypothetical protein